MCVLRVHLTYEYYGQILITHTFSVFDLWGDGLKVDMSIKTQLVVLPADIHTYILIQTLLRIHEWDITKNIHIYEFFVVFQSPNATKFNIKFFVYTFVRLKRKQIKNKNNKKNKSKKIAT